MADSPRPEDATRLIDDVTDDTRLMSNGDDATLLIDDLDDSTFIPSVDAPGSALAPTQVRASVADLNLPDPNAEYVVPEPEPEPEPAPQPEPQPTPQPERPERYFPQIESDFDEEHGVFQGGYTHALDRIDVAVQNPRSRRQTSIPHIEDDDGTGRNVPGEGRSRSIARPFLAFLLVATMVAGIFAAGTYGLELWGGKHLPNVVGLSEVKAREALDAKGFEVTVRNQIADDGIGMVLAQDPESGVRAAVGSRVTITVAANREMPDVVGRTQEEAQDMLAKAGAGEVHVEVESSAEEEGTVLAVTPAPGQPFTSHQTITLLVSQKPQVPDVLGKGRVEAVSTLENAGFRVEVSFVVSDGAPNTVVAEDPAPETKLDPGSIVHLDLSQPMPENPLSILEYFDKSTPNIARYLPEQGFSRTSAHMLDGYAEVAYLSTEKGTLLFTSRPYSHAFDYSWDTYEDVLGEGASFLGIRWEVPAEMIPSTASSLDGTFTEELMSTCGLSNVSDVCMHNDIEVPKGATKNKTKFRCTYGEMGGYSWTVLVANENGTMRAAVSAMPTWAYKEYYDLSEYGDSICDMVAYADVYTEL